MKIYKFGGASIHSAQAIRNLCKIIEQPRQEEGLVIVVSAMGKMTNALEDLFFHSLTAGSLHEDAYEKLYQWHKDILWELLPQPMAEATQEKIDSFFVEMRKQIASGIRYAQQKEHLSDVDFFYDQVVSKGELCASVIVADFLATQGQTIVWKDARQLILTDNTFREGKVLWEETRNKILQEVSPCLANGCVVLTQGFLGSGSKGTTTLGREGSDYSAAVFAHVLDANEMTIWKDVPGLLNADPAYFAEAELLHSIPYGEATELAYYGAKIIHPKTIKPLENKGIPLRVRSFLDPQSEGSIIHAVATISPAIPSFIIKKNQVLLSIAAKDFSFIAEENLSAIYAKMATLGIKVNLTQNSAISFSACMDEDEDKVSILVADLRKSFKVLYNRGLELITIRRYNDQIISKVLKEREVLLEQRSRLTAQFIVG